MKNLGNFLKNTTGANIFSNLFDYGNSAGPTGANPSSYNPTSDFNAEFGGDFGGYEDLREHNQDGSGSYFGRPAGNAGRLPLESPYPKPQTPGITGEGGDGGVFDGGPAQIGGGGGSVFDFTKTGVNMDPYQEPDDRGMSNMISDRIQAILGGGQTRYSDDVVNSIKGKLLESSEGRRGANEKAIIADQKARGMYRAGETGKRLAENRMSAASDYTGGVREVLQAKATADFQDKMAALQQGEAWLNNLRNYSLSVDMTKQARAQLQANIALGMLKLNADRDSMNAQLKQNWQLALLGREPIEGRDFIWMDDGAGGRKKVPLAVLNQFNGTLG